MPPVAAPSCLGNVSAGIAARDRGTSGRGLANKAFAQVWSFGADTIVTWPVTGLNSVETGYLLRLADGSEVQARSVVITTGVSHRRLKAPGLSALIGAGVYCGAAGSEARAMAGRRVFIVGGANLQARRR
jgi:thioredoxin reductase (NADPH)